MSKTYLQQMCDKAREARVTNAERRVPCVVNAEIHSKGTTWDPEDLENVYCFLHDPFREEQ